MFLIEDDFYIECYEEIKEANRLYEIMRTIKNIDECYLYYFESMNKYINKYKKFRLKMINIYINDLKTIIKLDRS